MLTEGVVSGGSDHAVPGKTRTVAQGHAPFRFTKADRLLQRAEFISLSQFGKKIQNRHFIAFIAKGKKDRSRLGITITKRAGHAPTRNRIKRIVREHYRLNRHRVTEVLDINIIVKRQASTVSNKTLFLSLDNLFERITAHHCD